MASEVHFSDPPAFVDGSSIRATISDKADGWVVLKPVSGGCFEVPSGKIDYIEREKVY